MKSFIILTFLATWAAGHPQKTFKKEMAVASESASQAQSYSESSSFSKSSAFAKEMIDMKGMEMGKMGDMSTMFGMSGMGMPTTGGAPAASAAGANPAAAGGEPASSQAQEAGAGTAAGAADEVQSEGGKICIAEDELGPVNLSSIAKIVMNPGGAYAVLSTYKNCNKVAELLRGKPLESRDELNKLCLHGICDKDQHKTQGFDPVKTFVSDCTPCKTGLTSTCTVNAAASDNKDIKTYPDQVSVVWTDGKAYVLIVSCWTDGQKLWVTLSNDKMPIPEDVKKTVLDKVNELGLDMQDPVGLSYDSCKA